MYMYTIYPCCTFLQNSLSRRIKNLSLTRHSSNGKKTGLNHTYCFVKMHGPKMKGFAEMAIAKSRYELAPTQPTPMAREQPSKPFIAPRLVVAGKHGSQVVPKHTIPTIITPRDNASSKSATPTPVHVRAYSSPSPIPYHERSFSSPVDAASSPGSDEAYYSPVSPSHSSVMEGEDFRERSRPASGVLIRHNSRESFLSNDSMLNDRHERSQSFTGPMRDSDAVSVESSSSATSTASSKGAHNTYTVYNVRTCIEL